VIVLHAGFVKWYNGAKGYGYIFDPESFHDFWFHRDEIVSQNSGSGERLKVKNRIPVFYNTKIGEYGLEIASNVVDEVCPSRCLQFLQGVLWVYPYFLSGRNPSVFFPLHLVCVLLPTTVLSAL
jgi:cold shock CspA family protein